jgi:hypothetical protein
MVKKKFIQRRCVRKVPCSSLARSPRATILAVLSSRGSSSSSFSLLASLSLGVREASVVEKAPPSRTSTPVPYLRKDKDPGATPAVNLISVPSIDAASMDADLIILSSDSEDEVDWEALIAEDEINWEALASEDDDDVESVDSWSLSRI